eukprot:2976176-Rhodomonas_salina.1
MEEEEEEEGGRRKGVSARVALYVRITLKESASYGIKPTSFLFDNATCGTDIGYGTRYYPTHLLCSVRYWHSVWCCVVCGTGIAYRDSVGGRPEYGAT